MCALLTTIAAGNVGKSRSLGKLESPIRIMDSEENLNIDRESISLSNLLEEGDATEKEKAMPFGLGMEASSHMAKRR